MDQYFQLENLGQVRRFFQDGLTSLGMVWGRDKGHDCIEEASLLSSLSQFFLDLAIMTCLSDLRAEWRINALTFIPAFPFQLIFEYKQHNLDCSILGGVCVKTNFNVSSIDKGL